MLNNVATNVLLASAGVFLGVVNILAAAMSRLGANGGTKAAIVAGAAVGLTGAAVFTVQIRLEWSFAVSLAVSSVATFAIYRLARQGKLGVSHVGLIHERVNGSDSAEGPVTGEPEGEAERPVPQAEEQAALQALIEAQEKALSEAKAEQQALRESIKVQQQALQASREAEQEVSKGRLQGGRALMGHIGEPPAYLILRELAALKARVSELERALAVAEQEISLRDVEDLGEPETRRSARDTA